MKENSIEDIIEEKYIRYLNCETDILDLTIEEAVFILEKDKKNHYLLQEAYKVILSDYKKVLEDKKLFKHRLEVADEFIESRKPNLTPEQYDDLKYILNECDLDNTW